MSIADIKHKLNIFPNEDSLSWDECSALAKSHDMLLKLLKEVAEHDDVMWTLGKENRHQILDAISEAEA